MNAFGLPDPIPVHREPIYTPRVDLVSKYPTLPDAKQFRLPNIGFTVQKNAVDKGLAEADKRTGGKHTDKLDKAGQKVKDGLDKLDGKDDDIKNS